MEMECVVVAGEVQKCIVEAITNKQCVGPISCSWGWIGENAAALFASITAVLAIYIAWWQGRFTMKHNQLSVVPHLHFEKNFNNNEGPPSVTYTLLNNGLGPADLLSVQVKINGNEVPIESVVGTADRLADLFDPAFDLKIVNTPGRKPRYKLRHSVRFPSKKDKLPANNPHLLFTLYATDPENCTVSLDSYKALELANNLEITIKYTSLYGGEIFTVTSNQG